MSANKKGGFKSENSFDYRVATSSKIRARYPDRIPVIVERAKKAGDAPEIEKTKFLVPHDITVGKFMHDLRKHMTTLAPQKTIYLFVNNSLPPTASLMSAIYADYHDKDGFLYITYAGEEIFG